MIARVTAWEVREGGPAFNTRRTLYNSSGEVIGASYEGVSEVTMKFQVIGDIGAAQEFLNGVRVGQPIKSLSFGDIKPHGRRPEMKGRMYVFSE